MGFKSDNQGLEYPATSLKPPSNDISDMVPKSPKVREFRSIGVFNTSDDHTQQTILGRNAPMVKQESRIYHGAQRNGHVEISKLFDLLSSLKLTYVKLQEAHIDYDPKKISAADQEVVSLFDSLCKIKRFYREKLLKEANSLSSCSALLLAKTQVQERALEKLKSQAKSKYKEVATLRRKLQELEIGNKKLAEEVREWERKRFTGLHYSSFENVVKAVGKAIHDFVKPLITLMKLSGWDLDKAANAVESSVVYAKRSHKKYAFEAYVARRMFHGFSPDPCFLENVMSLGDPILGLMEEPKSNFAEFCRDKYMLVVHPEMEESFFGNLDHRRCVGSGIHPNTQFYHAFVRMASWVWYLKGFAGFIKPKAEMFGVKEGSDFSAVYMEVVEELKEYKAVLDGVSERYKVEFMVIPGFKVGETIVKSQVYVSDPVLSNDAR